MRSRLILILSIVALVGCQIPFVAPTGTSPDAPATVEGARPRTAPTLAGRVSFEERSVQANMADVAVSATVALINTGTNQTIHTALTNAAGEFVLDFADGYVADPTAVYYLEAVKGLGENQPGHEAVRVRTIVRYQDGWTSLTNKTPNVGVLVTPTTTALSIAAALRHGDPVLDFTTFIGSLSGENAGTYAPVTGVSLADFDAVTGLVASTLAADQDPVQSIGLFRPSTWHLLDHAISVSALTPNSGSAGTSVVLSGQGFTPEPSEYTVTFNGVAAPVSAANPVSLKTEVPVGATSGPTTVRFGKLVAIGPNFTVPVRVDALSPAQGPVGTVVTITGSGFGSFPSLHHVTVNGVPATVTAATPTQLTVTVPLTTSGPVTVGVAGETGVGPSFLMAPVVTAFTPLEGRSGTSVTITGTGFSLTPSENLVTFNGVPAAVTAASTTSLTVTVPLTSAGPVAVEIGGWKSTAASFAYDNPTLFAVYPRSAPAGAVLTLEGRFDAPTTVTFPGAAPVPAEVLGRHRAKVVVPPGASAGDMAVTSGVLTHTVPFHVLAAEPALGTFADNGSISGARFDAALAPANGHLYMLGGSMGRNPGLVQVRNVLRAPIGSNGELGSFVNTGIALGSGRDELTAHQIGKYLYAIGGFSAMNGVLNTLERAPINTDGSLGEFESAGTLVSPRRDHSSAIIGNYLYVFGGSSTYDSGGILNTVERARIQPDGSLGAFESAGTLVTARQNHTSEVIGDYLYVIGGANPYGFVERAPIHPDGSLGAFARVETSNLTVSRDGHASAIIGDHLYVLGGRTGGPTSVERARINADGTIEAFATVSGVSLVRPRRMSSGILLGSRFHILGGDLVNHAYQPLAPLESALIGGP